MSALVVESMSKSFGATAALSHASLRVDKGTIHALLGGNGSGKSTLIKCLAGVYTADAGDVAIHGRRIEARSITPSVAREEKLRFVHQDGGLVDSLTIAENFALVSGFPLTGPQINWKRLRQYSAELLARFEIAADPDTPVALLRPSQRTMVAIARALADQDADDHILLLDEPTAALPEHDSQELMAALRQRADSGQTIVLVSHRYPEIQGVADHVTVFRDGSVADSAPVADMGLDRLVSAMTGEAVDVLERHAITPKPRVRLETRALVAGSVRGIDMSVREGEVVGVAGLAGSGRSSVLRAMFGALPVLSGTIRLDGAPYVPTTPRAAMRAGIGSVPEDRHSDGVFTELSVRENFSITVLSKYWKWLRADNRGERKSADALVGQYAVRTGSIDQPVGTLSGGNQQKVMMGRWLQREPRVLLLDEPTQGVDVVARADIYRAVARAAGRGAAVVVASSDLDELLAMCNRVLVLRDGRAVADLDASTTPRERIARLMMADDDPVDAAPMTTESR